MRDSGRPGDARVTLSLKGRVPGRGGAAVLFAKEVCVSPSSPRRACVLYYNFSLPGGCSAGELGLERTQSLAVPPRVGSSCTSLKKMWRPGEKKEPQGVLYEDVPDDADDCKESLKVPWALGGRDGFRPRGSFGVCAQCKRRPR
ncbi:hypothetical protein P7K49_027087 [Saguinus oedipus]|uniref:Uncharacterized protein n=1 Tax=Saguinus oedipus TaxID=9490 RepID=A0ABQ9UF85_SAGOE|nr:hypothetical protein P7K49_027087 [Saguinus oedipus]